MAESSGIMSGSCVFVLILAIALIFSAIFAGLWWRAREQKYILAFVFSYAASGLGLFIGSQYTDVQNVLPNMARHTLTTFAMTAVVWGAIRRAGMPFNYLAYASIGALGILISVLASARADQTAMMYASHSHYALACALCAITLSFAPARRTIDRVITWLFALSAAQFFVRPLAALAIVGDLSPEAVRESPVFAALLLLMLFNATLTPLSLIVAIVMDQLGEQKRIAERDGLSGLSKSSAFESDAREMIERSSLQDYPLSLVVADLDHLEQVNAVVGIQGGNESISRFGRLIEQTIRKGDVAGKIAAGKFCIIVSDCQLVPARGLAERLRNSFTQVPRDLTGGGVASTASFGVAERRPDETYESLFARADAALARAKEAGRNCVVSEDALAGRLVTDPDDDLPAIKWNTAC